VKSYNNTVNVYKLLLGNCIGKQGQKRFSVWSMLGSSQQPMDGLDGDHVVLPTVMSCNNRRAVFSVRGRCRRFITHTAHRLLGLGMWRLEDFVCAVVQ
jgi:hypothetical protein